jgi:hypoxanthine phosphoribosyltransferase
MGGTRDHEDDTGSTMSQAQTEEHEVRFAHPSEQEFSRILDFYEIEWEYEPTFFTLRTDKEGNVLEAFSPDFYLPQHDLYIELTTLRQQLITRKRRKIRQLKKLHPSINIKLVTRKAFTELLTKYGLTDHKAELVGQAALDTANGK